MVFFTCAICDIEDGLINLVSLDPNVLARIRASAMPNKWRELTRDKDNLSATGCDRAYATAAFNELSSDGLIKDLDLICKTCLRQLPKLRKTKPVEDGSVGNDEDDHDNSESDHDNSESDHDDDESNDNHEEVEVMSKINFKASCDALMCPKYALVNGLFRGKNAFSSAFYFI